MTKKETMPGLQEIDRRIKSIKSTKKVTRAMQMVSASKMRKAQSATIGSRSYAEKARELISEISQAIDSNHVLLRNFPDKNKVGIILITTNRGLVGSFNTNLLNTLKRYEKDNTEVLAELVVVGKKGREATARSKKNIIAEFPKLDTTISVEDIYPLAKLITDSYSSGNFREIVLIYNHFVSTLSQKPTLKTLLPFKLGNTEKEATAEHLYEPSPEIVMNQLIPRIIESQLYQAILESDASEHSARMVMMKNATEAAGDLIQDLTLTFNQLRQNKITTELSEITAGKIALEDR
jgi:F-type H+-transporting ATPase subunit gamma